MYPLYKTEKSSSPLAYDSSGASRFAAFLLAISEINNKNDGIADHLLPDTQILVSFRDSKRDEAVAVLGAVELSYTAFDGLGCHAIIGPASSSPAKSASFVFQSAKLVQLSYASSSPDLSNKELYPYFCRTAISDDYEMIAMVSLAVEFGFQQIATVTASDRTSSSELLISLATSRGVEVLRDVGFEKDQDDLSEEIIRLRDSKANIVFVVATIDDVAAFLVSADTEGLLEDPYVWFAPSTMFERWAEMEAAYGGEATTALLRGMIVVSVVYDTTLPSYEGFLERWLAHEATATFDAEGEVLSCSDETDDDGNYLWHQDHDNDPDTPDACSGIGYELDDIHGGALESYDGVYLMAQAFHRILYDNGALEWDVEDVKAAYSAQAFFGASGFVELSEDPWGDRAGSEFAVYNHHGRSPGDFVRVGSWSESAGLELCTGDENDSGSCEGTLVLNTIDNEIPDSNVFIGCDPGSLPSSTGVCVPCDAGTYHLAGVDGAADSCVPCEPGTASTAVGVADGCPICEPGTFALGPGALECDLCAFAKYNPSPAQTTCVSCPSHSQADTRGAIIITDCHCVVGFYETVPDSRICVECPEGGACAGREAAPLPLPSYWASAEHPTTMYLCLHDEACPGGALDYCGPHYTDRLCSSCEVSHHMVAGECAECPPSSDGLVAFFALLTFPLAVMFYKFANSRELRKARTTVGVSSSVGLLVSYVQVFAVFQRLDVNFPAGVEALMNALSAINVDLEVLQAGCVMDPSYSERLAIKLSIPFYIAIVFGMVHLGSQVYAQMARRVISWNDVTHPVASGSDEVTTEVSSKPVKRTWLWRASVGLGLQRGFAAQPWDVNKTLNALGLAIEVMYIFMLKASMQLFECYEQPNGDRHLLSQPSIRCGDEQWTKALPLAVLGFIFYSAGPLVVFGGALWLAPSRPRDAPLVARLKFLLLRFRPNKWYWGVLLLLRKFSITMVISLAADDALVQSSLSMVLLLCFLVLQLMNWPYYVDSINYLDTFLLTNHLAIIIASITFIVEDGDAGSGGRRAAAGTSIMALVMLALLVCGGLLLLELRWVGQNERRAAAAALRSVEGGKVVSRETSPRVREFEKALGPLMGTQALAEWYSEACAHDRALLVGLAQCIEADVHARTVDDDAEHVASSPNRKMNRRVSTHTGDISMQKRTSVDENELRRGYGGNSSSQQVVAPGGGVILALEAWGS